MKRPSNFYWTASLCVGVASLPRRQAGLPDGKAGVRLRAYKDFSPSLGSTHAIAIKLLPPSLGGGWGEVHFKEIYCYSVVTFRVSK